MSDRIHRDRELWVVPDEPRPDFTRREVALAFLAAFLLLAGTYLVLVALFASVPE